MVDFPKDLIDMLRNVEGVVDRACGVEQDHADDEDAQAFRCMVPGADAALIKSGVAATIAVSIAIK